MITVYIPPNFIPERTYAVKMLLDHYCGIETRILSRPGQIHYEVTWLNKSIVVEDHFFGKTYVGETYLESTRIPGNMHSAKSAALDNVVVIFGEDHIDISQDHILTKVDLFAGAFFMLTRWEESFGFYEDNHGRFPADKALVVKSGFILRPVMDEYVVLIKKWLALIGCDIPADKSQFKIIPTCDIDIPFYWRSKAAWKILAGRLLRHKNFAYLRQDWSTLKSMRHGAGKDPYDTFEYLMSLAEKNDLRFTFYMLAGGESIFEGYYDIDDAQIITLMKKFTSRGHSLGLHPSYNTFNDPGKLDKERANLEKHSGNTIHMSRQHYLRFAVPATWRHLHNAYLKEDSTLGYAAEPGFRCGTSKAFPVFDVHHRKQLPLIERPLLIMDVSLKMYKQFSIEESKAYCNQIIDQVKRHNGELVFLWHNSSLSELDGWTGWNEVLELLIAEG